MKIDKGIAMLDIKSQLSNVAGYMHPTLIWDENEVVLIDTGLPMQLESFKTAFKELDLPFEKLTKVIITHHDMDHIGTLSAILRENPHISVYAHEAEKLYIEFKKPPIKFSPEQIAALKNKTDASQGSPFGDVAALKGRVDILVSDGEILPFCGGITVIHTPGHTPGHICLYHKSSNSLIVGDALNIYEGMLVGPAPQFTYDLELGLASIKKLLPFKAENIITYHGGLFKDTLGENLTKLADAK